MTLKLYILQKQRSGLNGFHHRRYNLYDFTEIILNIIFDALPQINGNRDGGFSA